TDGNSWTPMNNGLTYKNINSLAVIGNRIFAGSAAGVFLFNPATSVWSSVNSGLYTNVVTLLAGGTKLYAGTLKGVFISGDYGATWTEKSTGLTNKEVRALLIAGNELFAGTSGTGVWKITLSEITAAPLTANVDDIRIFPNPAFGKVSLSFTHPPLDAFRLVVYDLSGKPVLDQTLDWGGRHSGELDVAALASGLYFIEVAGKEIISRQKLVIGK
ncbi:MAG TPA: T9SS type A sorting domain-containing protein, partial [Prolixibacteraceae bacterium]|nr:T9SS type A sorting domain-containing protein [Prolixibacteraceae bacterium]